MTSDRGRTLHVPAVLVEEPQFRLLFLGQVLSVLGDRVVMVVLPFAVLSVGGGVRAVALVSTAQFLPFAILALPAGVWADRLERKRILIVSDSVRLGAQLIAGVLLVSGHATVTHLVVLAAIYGAAEAFFAPAFTGLLPSTVSLRNIQPANALRGLSMSTGSIVGPGIAAGLVALAGPGDALLFDAATFAVSVACLIRLRPRAVPPVESDGQDEPSAGFTMSLVEGWREVRSRRWVEAGLLGLSSYHVAVLPAIFVLGPVLAQRDFGGAKGWALISVGFGLGSLLGDLLLLAWRPRFAMRTSVLMLLGAACQAAIIGSGLGVLAIAGLEVLAGICVTGFFSLWETSLQEHIPNASLSRVSSYDYLGSVGLLPLGNLVAGAVSAAVGLRPTLLGMSAVSIVAALGILAVPDVRHLPRGDVVSG